MHVDKPTIPTTSPLVGVRTADRRLEKGRMGEEICWQKWKVQARDVNPHTLSFPSISPMLAPAKSSKVADVAQHRIPMLVKIASR